MSTKPTKQDPPRLPLVTISLENWDVLMDAFEAKASEFRRRHIVMALTLTESGQRKANLGIGDEKPRPFGWFPHATDYETFLKWWTSKHGSDGLRSEAFSYAEAHGYIEARPWIQPPPVQHVEHASHVFHPLSDGNRFEIHFEGNNHIAMSKGARIVYALVSESEKEFPALELAHLLESDQNDCELFDPENDGLPATDRKTLQDCNNRLSEIKREREKTSNPMELKELDTEGEKISRYIQGAADIRNQPRQQGNTQHKAANAITKAITRFRKELVKSGLTECANHFWYSIPRANYAFQYAPKQPIEWDTTVR